MAVGQANHRIKVMFRMHQSSAVRRQLWPDCALDHRGSLLDSGAMRAFLRSVFLFAAASLFAEPAAPSAEQIEAWAAFPKPVRLDRSMQHAKRWEERGEMIWGCEYRGNKETACSYSIQLYKAGTLFREHRAKMERHIADWEEFYKKFAENVKDPCEKKEIMNSSRIETRPDGRKVYFTEMGFGPGGTVYGVFTTLGKYDLLLTQYFSTQDGVPKEERVQHRIRPGNELSTVFRKLEEYVKAAK